MSATALAPPRVPSSVVLVPTQSITQFVVQKLLEGLPVRVTVGERTYDGYVRSLDFARGSNYVFASVHIPTPEGEEEIDTVRVAIHLDGTVTVLPSDDGK